MKTWAFFPELLFNQILKSVFFLMKRKSVTFEIKSGFVGFQGKVISSRNIAGAGKQMPGGSRGMNWVCLERAQMSLRQVSTLLAAGVQFCCAGSDVNCSDCNQLHYITDTTRSIWQHLTLLLFEEDIM